MIRRHLATCAVVLTLLPFAVACGGDDSGDGGSTEVKTIEVTVQDGEVSPTGDRIDVDVDQPVDIVVTSDVAGELHVHSSPEETFEFEAGTNEPLKLQFERPGLVDVELHEPAELPVLQLQVS